MRLERGQSCPVGRVVGVANQCGVAVPGQEVEEAAASGRHGHVFRFIDADGSRVTDLALRSGLTKQGIGDVVVELEQLGYVERQPAPVDGRAKIVRLTSRGFEGRAAAARVLAEIEVWEKPPVLVNLEPPYEARQGKVGLCRQARCKPGKVEWPEGPLWVASG